MEKNKSQLINKDKLIILFVLIFAFFVVFHLSSVKGGSSIREEKDTVKLPVEIKERLKNSTASATFRVPILLYHYVEYVKDPGDTIRKSLDIVPFVFENQLKTLQGAGYTFITPADVARAIDGKENLPPQPIILSFDDGYRDFYDNVFPLLKKYNVRGVAYIISGFLNRPNFMYAWQVQDLERSGLIEIGAHTVHHVYLKGVSKSVADYEIKQSKKDLEDLISVPVVSFAYPSGAFDLQAEAIVKDAGFTSAASTVPGIDISDMDRFFMYRIRPGNRMGYNLLNYLSQNSFRPY